MKTYNGIIVPETIKTEYIISAFANEIDQEKLEKYTQIMQQEMLQHNFLPIFGYPSILDESDIGNKFLTGKEVTEEHIGKLVWFVTDGHHRSLAAIDANIPWLRVELDYNTITSEEDMKNYCAD